MKFVPLALVVSWSFFAERLGYALLGSVCALALARYLRWRRKRALERLVEASIAVVDEQLAKAQAHRDSTNPPAPTTPRDGGRVA